MNEVQPTIRPKLLREKLKQAKQRASLITTFNYDTMFVTDKATNTKVHVSKVHQYVKQRDKANGISSKPTSPIKSESTQDLSLSSHSDNDSVEIIAPDINMLSVYSEMEPHTVILSVEYCHSCDDHPMTLRHHSEEYLHRMKECLRYLAEKVFSTYPCLKLGVLSVPARVARKDGGLCRVGAFEVQVAYAGLDYKKRHNTPYVDILHSKLCSRRWPSRVVLEKRICSFLSRSAIRYFHHVPGGGTGAAAAARNLAFSWYSTPLANPDWKATPAKNIPGNMEDDVVWVFDYRVCLYIGQAVEVRGHRLPFTPAGCTETRIPFSGRVLDVEVDVHSSEWLLVVLPRFGSTPVLCPVQCCSVGDGRAGGMLRGSNADMWAVLRAVLNHARSPNNNFTWKLFCAEDCEIRPCLAPSSRGHDGSCTEESIEQRTEILLTPSSYYMQVGQLAWEIVQSCSALSSLPPGAVTVDYIYSDDAMEWLLQQRAFVTSDGLVNVTRLSEYIAAMDKKNTKELAETKHISNMEEGRMGQVVCSDVPSLEALVRAQSSNDSEKDATANEYAVGVGTSQRPMRCALARAMSSDLVSAVFHAVALRVSQTRQLERAKMMKYIATLF